MVTVREIFEKGTRTTGRVESVKDVLEKRYEREQVSHYERQAAPIKQANIEKLNNYIQSLQKSIEDYRNKIKKYEEKRAGERDSKEREWYEDKIDEYKDEISAREEALKVAKQEFEKYEKISDWRDILGYGESYADKVISYSKEVQYYEEARSEESRRRQEWLRKFKETPEYKELESKYPYLKNQSSYYDVTKAINLYNKNLEEAKKLEKEIKVYEIKEGKTIKQPQQKIEQFKQQVNLTPSFLAPQMTMITPHPSLNFNLQQQKAPSLLAKPIYNEKGEVIGMQDTIAQIIRLPTVEEKLLYSKVRIEKPIKEIRPIRIKSFEEIKYDIMKAPTFSEKFKVAYGELYNKIVSKSGEKYIGEKESIMRDELRAKIQNMSVDEALKLSDWQFKNVFFSKDFLTKFEGGKTVTEETYAYVLSEKIWDDLSKKYYSERSNYIENLKEKSNRGEISEDNLVKEIERDYKNWLEKGSGKEYYEKYKEGFNQAVKNYSSKPSWKTLSKVAIIGTATFIASYGVGLLGATGTALGLTIAYGAAAIGTASFIDSSIAYGANIYDRIMNLKVNNMLTAENIAKEFFSDVLVMGSTIAGGYFGSKMASQKVASIYNQFGEETTKKFITDIEFRKKYLTQSNINKGYAEISYKSGLLKYDFKYPLTNKVVNDLNFLHQVYREGGLSAKPIQATKYIGISEREKMLIANNLKVILDKETFNYGSTTIKKIAQTQVTPKLNIPHSKTNIWYSVGGTLNGKYVEVLFQLTNAGKAYNYYIITKTPSPINNRVVLIDIAKVLITPKDYKLGQFVLTSKQVKYEGRRLVLLKEADGSVLDNYNIVIKNYDVLAKQYYGMIKVGTKIPLSTFAYGEKDTTLISYKGKGTIEKGKLSVMETPYNIDVFAGEMKELARGFSSQLDVKPYATKKTPFSKTFGLEKARGFSSQLDVKPYATKKTPFSKTFGLEKKEVQTIKAKEQNLISKISGELDELTKSLTILPKQEKIKVKSPKLTQKQAQQQIPILIPKESSLEKSFEDLAKKSSEKAKEKTEVVPKQDARQVLEEKTMQEMKEIVLPLEKQIDDLRRLQIPKQEIKLGVKQAVKEESLQQLKPLLTTTPTAHKIGFSFTPPKIVTPKIKIPKITLKLSAGDGISKKGVEKKAYVPQIRRKGKWLDVSESLDSFEAAFSLGKEKAKKTLAASFRVVEKKEKPKRKALAWGLDLSTNDFYKKMEETPVYIQKKEKRLSTKEEVKEIQKARKQAESFWLR